MPETPDELRVRDFNAAAEALLQQRDRAQLPLAQIYLQRAQAIPAVSARLRHRTSLLLEQLAFMEQNPDIFFP